MKNNAFIKMCKNYGIQSKDINRFANCLLRKFFNIEKFMSLMDETSQVSFNYDVEAKEFELVDPFGLMGECDKKFAVNNF